MITLLLACAEAVDSGTPDDTFSYPKDDQLSIADVQMLATHNSYHVQTSDLDEWAYTHVPLDQQAEEQGVRGFELDVNYDEDADDLLVYHIALLDQGTTCVRFVDCLTTLKGWSDDHPAHHLLLTTIEMKMEVTQLDDPAHVLDLLETQIDEVWPAERVLTPDDVTGSEATLRDAISNVGWPTLGETRQQIMFAFDNDDWDAYTSAEFTSLAGRTVFSGADGDTTLATSAFHILNDATDPHIPEVVATGQLVRTRADSDGSAAETTDSTLRDAAYASGAHLISTDWPAPADNGYVVAIPGGTPSRCNPVHAPADCVSTDIEDPSFM